MRWGLQCLRFSNRLPETSTQPSISILRSAKKGATLKKLGRILSISLLATLPAWPQASTSVVRGGIRDASDAVIPNAAVTLTGDATNVERKSTTNAAGLFVFRRGSRPLPDCRGVARMQRFEGTLTVQVQVDAELNVVLKVGAATTRVEVRKLHR
jgi:hypothetical protein